MIRRSLLRLPCALPGGAFGLPQSQARIQSSAPHIPALSAVCVSKRSASGDAKRLTRDTMTAILPNANRRQERERRYRSRDNDRDTYEDKQESKANGMFVYDEVAVQPDPQQDAHTAIRGAVQSGEMTPAVALDEHMKVLVRHNEDQAASYRGKRMPAFMRDHGSVLNMVNIEQMIQAGVHYGHHRSYWNPLMEPYIYGTRDDIHIFDLEQTATHLRRALDVLRHVAYRGGMILFVSNRLQFQKMARYAALNCGEFYVTEKWRAGCFSNRHEMLRSDVVPDFVVLLTLPVSKLALQECNLMHIPTMAIVDSDQDPMSVTYMIPGNDDTKTAMKYYCDLMEKAVIEGKYCRANLINLVDVGATPESPGVLAGGLASA